MARAASTNGLTISQLQQILNQRTGELKRLYKKRAKIQRELDGVERDIARLEGGAGLGRIRGGGGRARNAQSLVATLESVLSDAGKPLPVGDILSGVERAGYRSNAANFRALINQTLIKEDRFKQFGRGVYGLRAGKRSKVQEAA